MLGGPFDSLRGYSLCSFFWPVFTRPFVLFDPLCWPPLFFFSSRRLFALFSPSRNALFCRAMGIAQSLEREFRVDLFPRICAKKGPGKSSSAGKSQYQCRGLSAAFYAAYGFTGAFGRNLCKFIFPQRRRNLRKSLLFATRPTGVKRAKKWLR